MGPVAMAVKVNEIMELGLFLIIEIQCNGPGKHNPRGTAAIHQHAADDKDGYMIRNQADAGACHEHIEFGQQDRAPAQVVGTGPIPQIREGHGDHGQGQCELGSPDTDGKCRLQRGERRNDQLGAGRPQCGNQHKYDQYHTIIGLFIALWYPGCGHGVSSQLFIGKVTGK